MFTANRFVFYEDEDYEKDYVFIFALHSVDMFYIRLCRCGGRTGYRQENRKTVPEENAYVMETAAPVEEGYYMVEGSLCEMGKRSIVLKTEDGQELSFMLAPETIIYAGSDKELSEGETIRVVFDGIKTDSQWEDISVIAVTVIEE